jgi:drug/metabolite transporter (DMT)-like permease
VFQAGLRAGIGCILILAWCWLRRVRLFARDGTLGAGIVAGVLFGAEFMLIYIGLDYTTVSRGIVFLYVTPLIVAVGAHFLIPGERLTGTRAAGLVAAFLGVIIAFSDRISLPSPEALIGDGLCLAAAFGWGSTTLVIRTTRLNIAAPEKVLAYQLAFGAAIPLALAPFFGPFVRQFDWLVAAAFAYQAVAVVAASYLAWFWLIARYPATQLSAFTFLTPVFSVAFGGLILSEPVSLNLVAALALVASGIYLVNQ